MATAFAITGIHRSRLKHYRPSYQSELPPIYEDAAQRQQYNSENTMSSKADYIYVPSSTKNGLFYKYNERNGNFVHDYEEIDVEKLSQVKSSRQRTPVQTANTAMLDGIMCNRFQLKNKSMDSNLQNNCDSVNGDLTGEIPASSLRRSSSVYQGYSLTNGETTVIRTNAETTDEMNPSKGTGWQWQKLKPDAFIDPHFWCPAEKKIQKRCFAVCFIVLLVIIVIFVIVSLDGWIYSARGRGLAGTDKPIVFSAPPIPTNFTNTHEDDNTN